MQATRIGDFEVHRITEFEGPFITPEIFFPDFDPEVQSVLVDDDYAFEDGLWFESAPGHTFGNVVIHARSRDDLAVFLGDVLHHQLQLARPEWSTLACTDRELSRTTRMRLVEEYAERGTRLLPAHFPAPTVGRIVRHASAYRYVFE